MCWSGHRPPLRWLVRQLGMRVERVCSCIPKTCVLACITTEQGGRQLLAHVRLKRTCSDHPHHVDVV